MGNDKKTLRFSEPFYSTYLIEDARDHWLKGRAIVLNLGKGSALIGGQLLKPLKSAIFADTPVEKAERLMCVEIGNDRNHPGQSKYSQEVKKKWQHVHEVFRLPHLEKTQLWRSPKEKAGDFEFNLWFASAGTDCGLHNKHGFKEIHTQIFGRGRMQKFRENDKKALYSEVLMAPGYTHDPFYDVGGAYPWHQYYADTDCIWLATEFK